MTPLVLTRRALNRATLERQLLLHRWELPVQETLERLVGLQAQTPHTAYVGLWSRLRDFRPGELSDLIVDRAVVRMALMRSTIHLVTAADALALRPLVQPVIDRTQQGQFGRRLEGVDRSAVVAAARTLLDERPTTFRALGDHLLERWPGRDRFALEQAVRAAIPLVQVPPRGLWGRSGLIAHVSVEAWLGDRPAPTLTLDGLVLRYLAAFGPATVMDVQQWSGLTRLREVVERLRADLIVFVDEEGREVFDLPDSPRPDPDTPAPVRFLYDYENLLLSHRDRSRFLSPEVAGSIIEDGSIYGTFLVDGVVGGLWRIDRTRAEAVLELRLAAPLSRSDVSAVTDEGARLLEFVAADAARHDIRVEVR